MRYEKLIIYYFSGTGNAKKAAEWIIEVANEKGLKTELINIESNRIIEKHNTNEKCLIGFCAPTHGFNFPPIMLNFIARFPRSKRANVFILNTRAGMKLHRIFLPGLSGIAQYFAATVLALKGYKVVAMQPLDLPSNWISIHPGLRKKVVLSIFSRCKKITKRFAEKIISGEKRYKALLSLPFDIAIAPISIAYYLIGRFAIAKTFIASDLCSNCGLCEKKCPVKAIKKSKDRPYWTFNCESCMHCMNYCPERAIETCHGFTIILWWLAFSIVPYFLLQLILEYTFLNIEESGIFYTFLYYLVQWGGGLLIIYFAYRMLHFLMRFKIFNKLITYTSFSKYKFWRRYKAPKTIIKAPYES